MCVKHGCWMSCQEVKNYHDNNCRFVLRIKMVGKSGRRLSGQWQKKMEKNFWLITGDVCRIFCVSYEKFSNEHQKLSILTENLWNINDLGIFSWAKGLIENEVRWKLKSIRISRPFWHHFCKALKAPHSLKIFDAC